MVKLVCAVVAVCGTAAAAQEYQFVINPSPSGLSGSLSVGLDTGGTLIGNYNEQTNPTGTRTKPGIFGTFGATENVSVPVSVAVNVAGGLNSTSSGGFRLNLNPGAGQLSIDTYSADFLKSGPINLPITLGLLYDSFRTRAPSSTFIGGFPLNIPFGEASLTQLSAEQIGSAPGTLIPTGPGTFDFTLSPIVQITAEFSALGNSFMVPGAPAPLLLQGSLVLTGNTAHFVSIQPVVQGGSIMPGLALPQIPFDLPTILPPGGTAQLLMDLTLQEVAISLDAMLTTDATGTLVPAPAGLVLLAAGGALAAARRRRR